MDMLDMIEAARQLEELASTTDDAEASERLRQAASTMSIALFLQAWIEYEEASRRAAEMGLLDDDGE